MADLEEAGYLVAPHTSAGRLPTEAGLRLFVDGILQVGELAEDERAQLDAQLAGSGRNVDGLFDDVSRALSGLSKGAGLVLAPKTDVPLRHIEFVSLSPTRALAVLVTENGMVENRVIEVPAGLPASSLVMASNYLSARLVGRTLGEAQTLIQDELANHRDQIDELTRRVVETGLATWAGEQRSGLLVVRGQANLLEDVTALADLERIRALFQSLETKETVARLLSLADRAEGVRIFIGAENGLFALAGCSVVVSPYVDSRHKVVGAIGVIGPMRMNYARIIPMVDYTAKLMSRLIDRT